MRSKVIGLVIFIVIIIVGLVLGLNIGREPKVIISGYVGGEKIGFLQDEEVIELLAKKYNIEVDYTKAGSYEMVLGDVSDMDFLFPSSQVALEMFKIENQSKILKSKNVFNSPIVFYSWNDVAVALEKEGIVEKKDNNYYVVDTAKLIEYTVDGTKWEDIGVDLYGDVRVICTDPNKSNSGNMYSGLLANLLNDGQVVDDESVEGIRTQLEDVFNKLGFMESSSGTLFERYLTRGIGDSPIIVGYENQIVEFAIDNPEIWESAKSEVAILYPEPTVWSEHPVIALTEEGKLLIEALEDEEIQQLAWENHGFRYSAFSMGENKASGLEVPKTLNKIIDMPTVEAMKKIMEYIK